MIEALKEQIDSKLSTLEREAAQKAVSNGEMRTNINEVRKFIKNSFDLVKKSDHTFTELETQEILDRINKLGVEYRCIWAVSPKSFTAKKVAVYSTIGTVIVSGAIVSLVGCTTQRKTLNENEVTTETGIDIPILDIEAKVEQTMGEEYKIMADQIVISMNDSISKGFEVTEENKLKMSKLYTEYYILNQMDTLTDEQWANIFQNTSITAKDLMNAKDTMEFIDEQRVTVNPREMMLDYSTMFAGSDLTLLSTAEDLISDIKTAKKGDKKEAIGEFKKYINENLDNEKGRMQYSERALDTFRNVYFAAFDVLTNYKEIDDELESTVNSTITCSLEETKLDVESKSTKSLQSSFEIYMFEKLETRLENGWSYVANNEVNPYNDINEIALYVSENIDLTLYNEMPDYKEYLTKEFATGGKEVSKNDSGVPDGNGNIISNEQLVEHEISNSDPEAKEKLEQAVQEEVQQQSEESTRVTTNDASTGNEGTVLEGTADDNRNGFSAGYTAGNQGQSKPSYTGNAAYDAGLDSGYAQGVQDREALLNSLDKEEETTFVPVENGTETTTESEIKTEGYTEETPSVSEPIITEENNTNYGDYQTEFVPVENETEITSESEIKTYDYTEETPSVSEPIITEEDNSNYGDYQTEFVPVDEASIQDEIAKWNALKSYVMQYSVASEDNEIQRSKV